MHDLCGHKAGRAVKDQECCTKPYESDKGRMAAGFSNDTVACLLLIGYSVNLHLDVGFHSAGYPSTVGLGFASLQSCNIREQVIGGHGCRLLAEVLLTWGEEEWGG